MSRTNRSIALCLLLWITGCEPDNTDETTDSTTRTHCERAFCMPPCEAVKNVCPLGSKPTVCSDNVELIGDPGSDDNGSCFIQGTGCGDNNVWCCSK